LGVFAPIRYECLITENRKCNLQNLQFTSIKPLPFIKNINNKFKKYNKMFKKYKKMFKKYKNV